MFTQHVPPSYPPPSSLLPIVEECVTDLLKCQEIIESIDRLLNPKSAKQEMTPAEAKKARMKRAKEQQKQATTTEELASPMTAGADTNASASTAATTTLTISAATDSSDPSYTPPAASPARARAAHASLNASKGVLKVARKLKQNKVTLDSTAVATQSEFGDPLQLLNEERNKTIQVEVKELGDYFTLRAEMRKNPGGFRPASMSSSAITGMMLSKPSSAFARGQTGAFALKKGSTWKTLQKGVKGEVDLPPGVDLPMPLPSDYKPTTPSSLPSIMKTKSITKLSSGISKMSSSVLSLSSSSKLLKQVSSLRGKTPETHGQARSRARSISFEVDPLMDAGLPMTAPGAAPKSPALAAAKPSTAPSPGAETSGGIEASPTKDLLTQIKDAHNDFERVRELDSKVDMDKFREAFHESSNDKGKLEEERKKEEAKKNKIGGMFGGITKAVGRRVTQVKTLTQAVARAVTPEKMRGKSKQYVVGDGVSDEVVLKDAVAYWEKVIKEAKERETRKENAKDKDSGLGVDSPLDSGMLEVRPEKLKSKQAERIMQEKLDKATVQHSGVEWAEYNLGLVQFCNPDESKTSDALDSLLKAQRHFPDDAPTVLHIGQLQTAARSNIIKAAGLESLRKAHSLGIKNEVKGDHGSFFVESSGSFGAAAYENSELKQATVCMDHLLKNGLYYATDEALCTKAQIMLRRGQYEQAQKYYKCFGKEAMVKNLVAGEAVGDALEKERGERKGRGGRWGYVYPQFEKVGMSKNLQWCNAERRRETLMAADAAYAEDPRHLSR